jgi:hypothetical protein
MRLAWRMLFFDLKSRNFLQETLSSLLSKFVSLKSSVNRVTISVPSGLVAVFKPKDWTSSDVVSKIKGILLKGMLRPYAIVVIV